MTIAEKCITFCYYHSYDNSAQASSYCLSTQGEMSKYRTYVKYLKHFGILLIALPELVTTLLGVALIFTARYLSRKLETGMNRRIRQSLEQYLAHFRRFSYDTGDSSKLPAWVHLHYRSLDSNLSTWQSQRFRTTTHHTIAMERLSWRYNNIASSKASAERLAPARTGKLVHHTIDMERLSRLYAGRSNLK